MRSRKSKFRLGAQAPDFTLPFEEHSSFTLCEQLNHRYLFLGFIRGTWRPFCRRFMQQLMKSKDRLESLNCETVLIASQPLPPILRFARQEKFPFKILADADRQVTRLYGIYQPLGLLGVNVARPSAFLLDGQGVIVYQYVGSATNRPPLGEIRSFLESQLATAPVR